MSRELFLQPDLITLFIIASASSFAGILAGMLGIGGGIVIVPMIYYLLTYFGFDQSIIMHVAVGTSLFIIIPTGLRSAFEHSKRGSFKKSIFKKWFAPIALGSILGSYLAGISSFKGSLYFLQHWHQWFHIKCLPAVERMKH